MSMKQLTLTVDEATYSSAELLARKAGKSLSSLMLELIQRMAGAPEAEFERLVKEEERVRAQIQARGVAFSAADRLSREELYDRGSIR